MNKKGSFTDGIYYLVAIFAIAIIFIFSWKLMYDVNDSFQKSDIIVDDGKTMMQNTTDMFENLMDNSFMLIFVGLLIATVVGAYFIRSHPALFWISLPIMGIIIFIAALYGNLYHLIISNPSISGYVSNFTIMNFVFDNFVYFITGLLLILSVALFGKNIFARPEQ